ncbi:alpha/beta hydrolase [Geodermatophilus sp. DF01_2]|uniref:alpha/beta hydrolase n=1 Tax=Geodermatophilus sp. DF01-2 TaxID=2559610 RepID=UPI001430AE5C|nr:alpha/beta hydrolase [Geodermatophilus sp. DF01_2]
MTARLVEPDGHARKLCTLAEAGGTKGDAMARMDLRVRLIGRLVGLVSVSKMDDARLRKVQQRRIGHNPVTDLLFGAVAEGVRLTDRTAKGEIGPVPIRVYRPDQPVGTSLPLVVNFHGGGWTIGSLDTADWLCSHVSATTGAVVVSVDYRLAPGHRWPAAAEDCYQALVDVVDRAAEFGADAGRIAVMGDSAGGNLAAVVSLMARDRSGPPIAHQGLIYPAVDLTMSSPSIEQNAQAPILTKADCLAFRNHYLGGQDPKQPYASPLFADDLSGLPPALVQVAEHDPIRDDGRRYAAALTEAGVPVRLTEYVGMPHGYLAFPRLCRSAPQALAELCSEQATALARRP